MIRWHHFMTRRHHGVMRCHDMSTRRDMMTCHDMMTIVVLTLTVPEIFLYLCGCVAHVRQGGGPVGAFIYVAVGLFCRENCI